MSKVEFYQQISQQVSAIIGDEADIIANMANLSAILFDALEDVNWVGFYRVVDKVKSKQQELVLGPFQGKVACIRIPLGVGVCGTAAEHAKTQRIADVHQFSGHIACDATSNAEIVLPIKLHDKVIAVLDIDSRCVDRFDEQDQQGLEMIVQIFEHQLLQSQLLQSETSKH